MKLHRNLAEGVVECLTRIFAAGEPAEKALAHQLRINRKWGKRDRNFVAETTYDLVRWWRRLWFVEGGEPIVLPGQLTRLVGIYLSGKGVQLPDWEEFAGIDPQAVAQRQLEAEQNRAVAHAIPDWMHRQGLHDYGDEWEPLMSGLNKPASVFIRVNSLKTTPNELLQIFGKNNVAASAVPRQPDALKVEGNRRLNTLGVFSDGFFEVQDAASQQVAHFMQVQPNFTVVDACAGAGGKTLHLAALMQNRGRIIAADPDERKLVELEKRAKRAGLDNLEIRPLQDAADLSDLHGKADRVLLDAPCSGTGVLRRKPDTKWKTNPEKLESLMQLQQQILNDYAPLAKSGGVVTYVTCSIFKKENESQVRSFLDRNASEYELSEEKQLLPHRFDGDGFYMANILKK